MTNTPQPGQVITVTTRHPNLAVNRTSDFNTRTYKNVRVLTPLRWLSPHEFCIPSDGPESRFANIEQVEQEGDRATKFDTRVIHMKNVVQIDGMSVSSATSNVREVEVPASKGGTYTVRVEGDVGVSCTCKGYQFRRTCRHLNVSVDL